MVLGLLALGFGLAAFALAFQWRQTRGCLGFYGSRLAQGDLDRSAGGGLAAVRRSDPGPPRRARTVRRLPGGGARAPAPWAGRGRELRLDAATRGRAASQASWTVALAFFADPQGEPTGILAIGAEPAGGSLCVVGRPGRIGLGRLERGLATWIAAACPVAAGQGGTPP